MSASQIPNLKTLRRGGLRGRTRGNDSLATPDRSSITQGPSDRKDEIIRNTDNDAASSRLSAVEAGYLEDPFAKLLGGSGDAIKRLPLMNRGTYVRSSGIDRIVHTFIASEPDVRKQVISLGAGSDTRYFRLRRHKRDLNLLYHEIDLEANTTKKIGILKGHSFARIAKDQCGLDLLADEFHVSDGGAKLLSPNYNVIPLDLRKLSLDQAASSFVEQNLSTLIISECCLIYLPPAEADAVLEHFTNLFPLSSSLSVVIYEPIKPYDAFGRTMVSNLTARGIHLRTLEKYAGLKEQRGRLSKLGFHGDNQLEAGAQAADIYFIWRQWVNEKEKERVEGLEWMDETEEFVLLARHYCLSWGWRGFTGTPNWQSLEMPTENEYKT